MRKDGFTEVFFAPRYTKSCIIKKTVKQTNALIKTLFSQTKSNFSAIL